MKCNHGLELKQKSMKIYEKQQCALCINCKADKLSSKAATIDSMYVLNTHLSAHTAG